MLVVDRTALKVRKRLTDHNIAFIIMKNIINKTDVPVKKESTRRSQVSKYNSVWSLLDQILDLF